MTDPRVFTIGHSNHSLEAFLALLAKHRVTAVRIATIGFTRKPARRFFGLLREAGVKRVLDVRLNNASQLSGFAQRDDLALLPDKEIVLP